MKIRERLVHKYCRTGKTKVKNLFEGYSVTEVKKLSGGYTSIAIKGPRKTFSLISCARPLTIISPPEVEGGNAIKREVPLYFVSPMKGSGKIQGAEFFAEIDGELVAYRPAGAGTVEPL